MGDHDICPSCGGQSLDPALPGCETPHWSHPAPSVWLIMQSSETEGYNGMYWNYEDTDDSAARGYFAYKDDAEAWIVAEKQRLLDRAVVEYTQGRELALAESRRRYDAKVKVDRRRQVEHNALVKAGIKPSFKRPEIKPFKAERFPMFDEKRFWRDLGMSWETVEVKPNQVVEKGAQ